MFGEVVEAMSGASMSYGGGSGGGGTPVKDGQTSPKHSVPINVKLSKQEALSTTLQQKVSPFGKGQKQTLRRRQQLLRRIQSLKNRKTSVNSSPPPLKQRLSYRNRNIKFLSGSKLKDRLRQKRLRLKYFRQQDKPSTSYLYLHNIPRKVKRTLPSSGASKATTISQQ